MIEIIIDMKLYHLYRIFIANYKMSDIFNTIGHEWRHTCKQVDEVVSSARAMSGWALRTFKTRERFPMITVWNTIIRPSLDYCSPLWSPRPSNFKEIDLLEETLRSFTRKINGMDGLDYAQRLKKLNMNSVQRRHERYKIIYTYKIKEGLVPNISDAHGLKFKYGRLGCHCEVPIYPINGRAVKARDNSFALTARNLWNSLPRCVRDISGQKVEYFKRKLDGVLYCFPDVPRCSSQGHSQDKNGRNSNSLCDHYKNPRVKESMVTWSNWLIFRWNMLIQLNNCLGYVI